MTQYIFVVSHPFMGTVVLVDTDKDKAIERAVEKLTGGPQLLDDELADVTVESYPVHYAVQVE